MENKATIRDLIEFFDFERISGDDSSLDREIKVAYINRPGLELAGFYGYSDRRRIVALGYKEDDKVASAEITKRQIEIKEFLRRYFSSCFAYIRIISATFPPPLFGCPVITISCYVTILPHSN